MENPDIDRPAVHIELPLFRGAVCRLFLRRAVCRRFGGFAVRRRFSAFSV